MTEQPTDLPVPSPAEAKDRLEQALFEIRRVIAGQDDMLERVLVCLLAQGHLLIEGVPGLAKTLTIKTTAGVLGGSFSRVQFTPDLVPSDLVGTRIYRPGEGAFETELGPVFCNFLLADEINRAPAKVQSALLEVMQERQVTIGHTSYPVPDPFLVMATQNPIESEGTYPLPEAQIDRFMLKVLIDYPEHDEELTIVQRQLVAAPELRQALSLEDLQVAAAGSVRRVRRSGSRELRRRHRDRHAGAGRARRRGPEGLHRLRCEPARSDQPGAGVTRARARSRPRLRPGRRPARAREGRVAASPRPHVPGARGRGDAGHDSRHGAGRRSRSRRSTSPLPAQREPGAPLRADTCAAGAGAAAGCVAARARRQHRAQDGGPARGRLSLDAPRRRNRARSGSSLRSGDDDVRRIDWNVTARTNVPHVRVHLAERVLVTWLVLDTSASMQFGTADRRKADVAEGVAIAVGHIADETR